MNNSDLSLIFYSTLFYLPIIGIILVYLYILFPEFKKWLHEHFDLVYRVGILAFTILLAIFSITLNHYKVVIGYSPFSLWLTYALIDIGPELAGIAFSLVMIDFIFEKRQNDQQKRQFILQMGSCHNDVTDSATRNMRAYGWLIDGSLEEANLKGANLERVDLTEADLTRVDLTHANLTEANLYKTKLESANFEGASLQNANLVETNLAKAFLQEIDFETMHLYKVNLKGAYLGRSNFSNASLIDVNLENANLHDVNLEKASLKEVNLKGAYLQFVNLFQTTMEGVNLSGASLEGAKGWTIEQLLQAKNLENAIMPDGRFYEEWILELENQSVE